MADDPLGAQLDRVARWVDTVLALGLASLTEEHLAAGRTLAASLLGVGLVSVGSPLRAVLEAGASEQTICFGRLIVSLELAREAANIELLRSSDNATGEFLSGDEENDSADP